MKDNKQKRAKNFKRVAEKLCSATEESLTDYDFRQNIIDELNEVHEENDNRASMRHFRDTKY